VAGGDSNDTLTAVWAKTGSSATLGRRDPGGGRGRPLGGIGGDRLGAATTGHAGQAPGDNVLGPVMIS
jgi:hypothetical protein